MKLVGVLASRWRNNKPLKLIGLFAGKSLMISTFVSIQLNVVVSNIKTLSLQTKLTTVVDAVISSCGNACRTSCNIILSHQWLSYCMVVWYRTYFYLDYLLIGGIILPLK